MDRRKQLAVTTTSHRGKEWKGQNIQAPRGDCPFQDREARQLRHLSAACCPGFQKIKVRTMDSSLGVNSAALVKAHKCSEIGPGV